MNRKARQVLLYRLQSPWLLGLYRILLNPERFVGWAGDGWVLAQPDPKQLVPIGKTAAMHLMRRINEIRGVPISLSEARKKLNQRAKDKAP